MPESFGLEKNDIQVIIDILRKEKTIEQALIFGSRAKGNYKPGSDVDMALKGPNLSDDICTHISFILNEETAMPYKFDVVNYSTISNEDFANHIDRVGKIFYSKTPLISQ